jgi:prolyl-tRNA synthetase
MCPSDAGEDLVARCTACDYAANVEKATSVVPPVADVGADAVAPFDTPDVKTIEDLVKQYDVAADRQIKTLVYAVDEKLTLVLMRGDHALVEQKLLDTTGALAVRPAHPEEIRDALGASPGSLGSVDVKDLPIVADEALRGRRAMVTGANTDGVHLRGVDIERDIAVSRWADLREVTTGEPCPRCRSRLEVLRAIEVGHIFKLGYKYAEALDVSVLAPDGSRVRPIMGSYGIGVERAIAAIVETHHDELGIVWPTRMAPFEVAVVLLGARDEAAREAAETLYETLGSRGIEVILDDRDERPGVKFRDVELVGIPYRVTVGSRGLANGTVEVTVRATGDTTAVPVDEAADHITTALSA